MALTAQKIVAPFDHWIIDDFLDSDTALNIANEFPVWDSDQWFAYDNALERKKTIREWGCFARHSYGLFSWLCSTKFILDLRSLTGNNELEPDHGLHGAGWHMQHRGDYLNLHLDYATHPHLGWQRKYNLIIYLSPEWDPLWGGSLEFWSHDALREAPGQPVTSIESRFNRAVLFDTSGSAWHGVPQALMCPPDQYRRSIAMYYLVPPQKCQDTRPRARYAPRPEQQQDPAVLELIEKRCKI